VCLTAWSVGQAQSDGSAERQVLNRYCVTCHNSRMKTAGLMLDAPELANVAESAETWEKVLRKLRASAMPPINSPRPDPASYASLTSWVQNELDRAALGKPNPGRTPTYHRLNRLEYQNAIRDILGIDINVATLLPGDDAAFGFDNIGAMLTVSPDLLDGYLSAAHKITRLAVGDTAQSLGSATYPIVRSLLQNDRMSEELPFGSRGGAAIHHFFPADGEYAIRLEFHGSSRTPESVEVSVDGVRVTELKTTGRNQEDAKDKGAVEARIAVKAGPRVLGVTFVKPILPAETRYPQYFPWGNSSVFATNTGALGILSVDRVDITGPFNATGPGDTPSRRLIFQCHPANGREPANTRAEDACATRILGTLARRAFRRPVTNAEVQLLVAFYKDARKERDFEGAIQVALERLLVDPDFLFRVERDPAPAGNAAPGTAYRISDLELASRLSFFLWSSVPDEELIGFAERGRLKDQATLRRQVRRMLDDSRSSMLVDNFAAQWLYLRNVRLAKPDTFQFPDFDENLRDAMTEETKLFLESQLREDRGIGELLDANYTYLNERLAQHYGIPNVYGSHFRRVELTDKRRGGLLGQGSILLATSYANRTSPVVRGKWLLENFLNYQPPQPPPDVPPFPENAGDQHPRSVRERMEQHRSNPVCASCHAVMDPLGFSLEQYDAIGKFRTTDEGNPINASGAMPGGAPFDGLAGLRSVLEKRSDEFIETVTDKLLTYAIGRGSEYYDQPAIRKIVRDAKTDNYRWSSIILGIIESPAFQMRRRQL
jgi:Protein of unknown function (DUF1592)/Protein of unknown function (DUF1588)/Protein of unknown function (DUF1585)/Protein of unknown function (DUF1587)/Protein of unknown function (DUF1595)/Cytochrome C oxidase, cbb3-type, subunit III